MDRESIHTGLRADIVWVDGTSDRLRSRPDQLQIKEKGAEIALGNRLATLQQWKSIENIALTAEYPDGSYADLHIMPGFQLGGTSAPSPYSIASDRLAALKNAAEDAMAPPLHATGLSRPQLWRLFALPSRSTESVMPKY